VKKKREMKREMKKGWEKGSEARTKRINRILIGLGVQPVTFKPGVLKQHRYI